MPLIFKTKYLKFIFVYLKLDVFRGRDITSFRPADVHLGAYFKYTVDKTPYGGFA